MGKFYARGYTYEKTSKGMWTRTKKSTGDQKKMNWSSVKTVFSREYDKKLTKVVMKRKHMGKRRAEKLVQDWRNGKISAGDLY